MKYARALNIDILVFQYVVELVKLIVVLDQRGLMMMKIDIL